MLLSCKHKGQKISEVIYGFPQFSKKMNKKIGGIFEAIMQVGYLLFPLSFQHQKRPQAHQPFCHWLYFFYFSGPKTASGKINKNKMNLCQFDHKLERSCQKNCGPIFVWKKNTWSSVCTMQCSVILWKNLLPLNEASRSIPFLREIYEKFLLKQTRSKKHASNNLNTQVKIELMQITWNKKTKGLNG